MNESYEDQRLLDQSTIIDDVEVSPQEASDEGNDVSSHSSHSSVIRTYSNCWFIYRGD